MLPGTDIDQGQVAILTMSNFEAVDSMSLLLLRTSGPTRIDETLFG